jgi:hypothetical protein
MKFCGRNSLARLGGGLQFISITFLEKSFYINKKIWLNQPGKSYSGKLSFIFLAEVEGRKIFRIHHTSRVFNFVPAFSSLACTDIML